LIGPFFPANKRTLLIQQIALFHFYSSCWLEGCMALFFFMSLFPPLFPHLLPDCGPMQSTPDLFRHPTVSLHQIGHSFWDVDTVPFFTPLPLRKDLLFSSQPTESWPPRTSPPRHFPLRPFFHAPFLGARLSGAFSHLFLLLRLFFFFLAFVLPP